MSNIKTFVEKELMTCTVHRKKSKITKNGLPDGYAIAICNGLSRGIVSVSLHIHT